MRQRSAFTIVELLVVLAVIGLLMALLLPAVQRARAASHRLSCRNNLRQLGVALHHYHAAFDVFPPGSQVQDFSLPPGYSKSFGWTIAILPYIEQTQLYDLFDTDIDCQIHHRELTSRRVTALMCAADPRGGGPVYWEHPNGPHPVWGRYYQGEWGTTSYFGVSGTSGMQSISHFQDCDRLAASREHAGLHAGLLYGNSSVRLADIVDGSSNTALLVERGVVDEWGKWGGAGVVFACPFGVMDVVLPTVISASGGGLRAPSHSSADRLFLWSWHDGGTHFAKADGSVVFASYSRDRSIQAALGTRAGSETVAEW